jgi:hypothetical protein
MPLRRSFRRTVNYISMLFTPPSGRERQGLERIDNSVDALVAFVGHDRASKLFVERYFTPPNKDSGKE